MGGAKTAVREASLLVAAKNNELSRVTTILQGGELNGAQDTEGYSPLHWAVINRNPKMLGQLLCSLAIESRTFTANDDAKAIVLAAKESDWCSVLKFAEYPAVDRAGYDVALMYAVKANQSQVVSALLKAGAKCDAKSQDLQRTPLHHAVVNNNPVILRSLLEKNADQTLIDADDDNPLQIALKKQYWACVIELAKYPIETNAALYSQALLAAVRQNQYQAAKALLDAGADPCIVGEDDNKTTLHWAAFNNYPELAALLVRHGAKLDATDRDNHTAIQRAILDENIRLLNWLLYLDEHENKQASLKKQETLLLWASEHTKSETLHCFRVRETDTYQERPRDIEVLIGSHDIDEINRKKAELDFTKRLSNGLHPLSYAVKLDLLPVVKTLLDCIDQQDDSRQDAFQVAVAEERWECARAIDPERALVAYIDKCYYQRLSFFSCHNKQVKNGFIQMAKTTLQREESLDAKRFWGLLSEAKTAKYHQLKRWSTEDTRTVKSCKAEVRAVATP